MRIRNRRFTTYFIVPLLCIAFIVGGLWGGIIGGSLVWWALQPEGYVAVGSVVQVAALTPTATPTPTETATPLPSPTATPTAVLSQNPASIEDAVDEVLGSVVTVINHQSDYSFVFDDSDKRVVGSGFIVDPQGYIVTNAHVVAHVGNLNVVLSDARELTATLVVSDPSTDLALLKVETEGLSAATWGDSAEIRLGQSVVAIGSALGDFPNSVTVGVVSGLDRALALDQAVVQNLIQTDAAINQGNSGGPLINLHGEIIGINTFMIREDHNQGMAQGIGFAIPASSAQELVTTWISQAANTPLTINDQPIADVSMTPLPVQLSGDSK